MEDANRREIEIRVICAGGGVTTRGRREERNNRVSVEDLISFDRLAASTESTKRDNRSPPFPPFPFAAAIARRYLFYIIARVLQLFYVTPRSRKRQRALVTAAQTTNVLQ